MTSNNVNAEEELDISPLFEEWSLEWGAASGRTSVRRRGPRTMGPVIMPPRRPRTITSPSSISAVSTLSTRPSRPELLEEPRLHRRLAVPHAMLIASEEGPTPPPVVPDAAAPAPRPRWRAQPIMQLRRPEDRWWFNTTGAAPGG